MWKDIVATAIGIVLSVSGAVSDQAAQITAELRNAFMPAQSETTKVRTAAATSLALLPDPKHSTKWAEIRPPPSLFALAPGAAVAGQATATPASSDNASPAQTIINQPMIERTIERVVEAPATGYVTQSQLLAEIAALKNSFGTQLYGPSYPAPATTFNDSGIVGMIGAVGRIEHLYDLQLTDATVDGLSGLTDADIPDSLTASNYLPLTGGTLTGDLTMSGTLTAGALSVAGISSSGALIGPYVQATSTTATSTFASALAIGTTTATTMLAIQQLGGNLLQDWYDATGVKQADIRLQGTGVLGGRGIAINMADVTGAGGTFDNQFVLRFNGATNKILFSADNTASAINTGSGHPLYFRAGNTTFSTSTAHLAITTSGLIGIGNISPTYQLDVTGLGRFTGLVDAAHFVATSTTATTTLAGGLTVDGADFVVDPDAGRVGIGTASPDGKLNVVDGSFNLTAGNSTGLRVLTTGTTAWTNLGTTDSSLNILRWYSSSNSPLGVIDGSGNLGIASTTPWAKLSVTNAGSGPSFVVEDDTSPDTTPFIIDASGNVGIGTASPTAKLEVAGGASAGAMILNSNALDGYLYFGGPTGANSTYIYGFRNSGSAGRMHFYTDNTERLRIAADGKVAIGAGLTPQSTLDVSGSVAIGSYAGANVAPSNGMIVSGTVGIATTSPWRTVSVTGTVGFDGLTSSTGAGSLCLDSNKQVVYNSASDNCLSSTRATKHDIAPLSLDDLEIAERLEPVSFVYNEGDGRTRYGFIAEDTAAVDAHLATYNASGTVSGIDDRSIIAIVVGAIKELAATVRGFADRFTTNELTFDRARGEELTINKLCVGTTCVTEEQFKAVFGNQSVQTAAGAQSPGRGAAAPSGSSASVVEPDADPPTDTAPEAATSTQSHPAPANDPEVRPAADSGAGNDPSAAKPAGHEVEASEPEESPAAEFEPVNDNQSVDNFPPTVPAGGIQ